MGIAGDAADYQRRLAAESRKWGDHLAVESSGEWHAWLDHPAVARNYHARALIDNEPWERWVQRRFGGPAQRSLDLGCGSGHRSLHVYRSGSSTWIEGTDVSEDRVAEGERLRNEIGAPGRFWVGDANTLRLTPHHYDLIFSCHSFHHFLELEHVMLEVSRSLTPRGLFVLEEFVGPTQFQWTDRQIDVVRSVLALVPERFRMLRWGARKDLEGRPTPQEVMAASPFESIRSADIVPLFDRYFDIVAVRRLGGTVQHLLYNGIVHNFRPDDDTAARCVEGIMRVEDALIDTGMLPSDFMLLVGKPKGAP